MVRLEQEDSNEKHDLNEHGPQVPTSVPVGLHVDGVLSVESHDRLRLHLLAGRLNSTQQIAHVSDFLIAGQLDFFTEFLVGLASAWVERHRALTVIIDVVLNLIGFFLVGVNCQRGNFLRLVIQV